ncbi:MAG: hypothetical protein ABI823_09890 [Bryobacteraceae bacterium]
MRQLIGRSFASALLILFAASFAAGQEAAKEKKYKDKAEYDLYSGVTKDFAANDYAKAIAGLDTWTQKYPETDFHNERALLYVQAYFGAGQAAKAIDAAAPLIAAGPATLFPDPATVIRLLYTPTVAIQRVAAPTPEQEKTAESAARQLLAFNTMPKGMDEAAWQKARKEFEKTANGSLLYLKLVPIIQAMKVKDCKTAESLSTKALDVFPNSAQLAWYVGSAAYCQYKEDPSKVQLAMFEFARAAAIDPTIGMADPKWQQSTVEPNLKTVYEFYHGEDADGLKQLKEIAVKSPLPPAGFEIKSKTQIAQEKQQLFEKEHPELALWVRIKAALVAQNGEQYFASDLKGAAVPQLLGVLVGAKPECRPDELQIAIRTTPDQVLAPEIVLKLDKPLAGKPELQSQMRWEGVATSFTKDPFTLTMDVDSKKIEGLETTPCTPARKGASKSGRR